MVFSPLVFLLPSPDPGRDRDVGRVFEETKEVVRQRTEKKSWCRFEGSTSVSTGVRRTKGNVTLINELVSRSNNPRVTHDS